MSSVPLVDLEGGEEPTKRLKTEDPYEVDTDPDLSNSGEEDEEKELKNALDGDDKKDKQGKFKIVTKRPDYLVWWDYFMSVAYITSMRSKDPNTQVGACIVNESNRIVSLGYNGMPNGCDDDHLPWNRSAPSPLQTKYPYVCHAEMNAILNKTSHDLVGCTCFVLLFPCNECAKMIIQAGIKRVVYLSDKYHNDHKFQASKRLLTMAQIEMFQYTPTRKQILIDFDKVPK